MEEKITIEHSNVSTPIIDENGNVNENSDIFKWYIADNRKAVTKSYCAIGYLYDDYYAVLDTVSLHSVYNTLLDDKTALYKWGIICLKRNAKGKIIPFKEELVVPILYKYSAGNAIHSAGIGRITENPPEVHKLFVTKFVKLSKFL